MKSLVLVGNVAMFRSEKNLQKDEHLAESKTTNAAKTVDSNFNHGKDLLHTVSGGLMPHRYYYTRFPRVWQYL